MRRRTKSREKEEREYSKQRKIFLSSHPYCQAALPCCNGVSSQVHHKAGRIGSLLLDQTRWLSVCYNCHEHIERNPTEAKELGLSESRLSINHDRTVAEDQ